MASEKKFKPKYVAKVPIGKGKNRYFYTWPEYRAYKANKSTPKSATTKTAKTISKATKMPNKVAPTSKTISKQLMRTSNTSKTNQSRITPTTMPYKEAYTTQTKTRPADKAKRTEKPVNSSVKKSGKSSVNVLDKLVSAGKSFVDALTSKKEIKLPSKIIPKTSDSNPNSDKKQLDLLKAAIEPKILSEKYLSRLKAIGALKDKLFGVLNKTNRNTADAQDLKDTNPLFGTHDKYSTNCAYCTMAYELRQRGYDVEANPAYYDENGDLTTGLSVYQMMDVYEGAELTTAKEMFNLKEDPTSGRPGLTGNHSVRMWDSGYSATEIAQRVENDLLKHGEGARGVFTVMWGFYDMGHGMVWEVENGSVVIKDPQCNRVEPLEYYIPQISEFAYFRTDNLEINDTVLNYVHNAEDLSTNRKQLREEVERDERAKRLRTSGY